MTAVFKKIQMGYAAVLGGWSSMLRARVTKPALRYGATDAVLLIADPGVPPAAPAGYTWMIHARSMRIETSTGMMLINPLLTYTLRTGEGGSSLLPAYVEITLAGLAGDFAYLNGSWTCQMADMNIGMANGTEYVNIANPRDTTFGPRLEYYTGKWIIYLYSLLGRCHMTWELAQGLEDPEGSYTIVFCTDLDCIDTNSCANSVAATCVVKWLGSV